MKALAIVGAMAAVLVLAALVALAGIVAGALLALIAEGALDQAWSDESMDWFARAFGVLVGLVSAVLVGREVARLL